MDKQDDKNSASSASLAVPEDLGTSGQEPDRSEKWLWQDPLEFDERLKSGSVLLDDVIAKYVKEYSLLVEHEDFDSGKLKGGSLTMYPDENAGWRFMPSPTCPGRDCKVPLDIGKDHLGTFYWVPRNSLVYIRLRPKLRLPYYIIGRHNLKIRYVYKGLLLGTGPQVDPGFKGRLFIPLHNFTTSDVKVYIHESFVSMDFVRTTSFITAGSADLRTEGEFREYCRRNGRVIIEAHKIGHERDELEEYLQGATPRSQMEGFQEDFRQLNEKVRKELSRAKIVEFALVFGFIAILCTVLSFALDYRNAVVNDVRELKSEIQKQLQIGDVQTLRERVLSAEKLAESASNRIVDINLRVLGLANAQENLRTQFQTVTVPLPVSSQANELNR